MLTGLELTAFILAVFPLIVSAMEHYEHEFELMKDWIRFRAEFTAFTNALSPEH